MRLDVSDPFRVQPIPACTSAGRWCTRFWLGPGQLCEREIKAPRQCLRQPCPDVEWSRLLTFHLLARVVASDSQVHVLDGGTMRPAEVVWSEWQRARVAPPADALEYAATYGRCLCGWACTLCATDPTVAPCRIDGRCYFGEEHVAACRPDAVRWETQRRSDASSS